MTSVATPAPAEHLYLLVIGTGVLMLLGPWGLELVWLIALVVIAVAITAGTRRGGQLR